MTIVNDGFDFRAPRYGDQRQGKLVAGKSVPYDSTAEALAAINILYRAEGLTVYVKEGGIIKEYQFIGGIADVNLALKPAGGDLSSTYPNPSVVKLRGRSLSATAPTNGQALVYNSGTGVWEPGTVSGGGGGTLYDTIAAMRAAATPSGATLPYELKGYHAPNDGGGGNLYLYNPASVKADNGGTVIKPTAVGVGAGAYEMIVTGPIEAASFGATGDLENITVDVDATLMTITKKKFQYTTMMASGRWYVNYIHVPAAIGPGGTSWGIVGIPNNIPVGTVMEQLLYPANLYTNPASVDPDLLEWIRIGVVAGNSGTYSFVTNETSLVYDVTYAANTRWGVIADDVFDETDNGKTLVIEGGRNFATYNTLPVGLNAKITAIASGIATFVNLDTSRGVPVDVTGATYDGALVSNAVFFREATDALNAAIEYCEDNNLGDVILPAGEIGLMPIFSDIWALRPVFAVTVATAKSPLWFQGNTALQGKGNAASSISVHYAVPQRIWAGAGDPVFEDFFTFICDLFFVHPTANTETIKRFKDFTVKFPDTPDIRQNYRLFRDYADSAYLTPKRHAQKVYCENIKMICPSRNVELYFSNYGGIFESRFQATTGYVDRGTYNVLNTYSDNDVAVYPDELPYVRLFGGQWHQWFNKVIDKPVIEFKNCDLECYQSTIKQVLFTNPNLRGSKKFSLPGTIIRGGAKEVCKRYTGSKNVGGTTITINEAEYSPYNFNAHPQYASRNVMLTPVLIMKPNVKTVVSVVVSGANYSIVMSSVFGDATTANGKAWFAKDDFTHELFLDTAVVLTNGNATMTVNIVQTGRSLSEMSMLVDKEVRVYSLFDYHQVTGFGDTRTVTISEWNFYAGPNGGNSGVSNSIWLMPLTSNCNNMSGLDIIVNATWNDRNDGYSAHPIYNTSNLDQEFIDTQVLDCPNVFRISNEGTNILQGKTTMKNMVYPLSRGRAVFATGRAYYQPYFQIKGEVDIDDMEVFHNDDAAYGVIRNTNITQLVMSAQTGSTSLIENCTAGCRIGPTYGSGKVIIKDCVANGTTTLAGSNAEFINVTDRIILKGGTVIVRDSTVDLQFDPAEVAALPAMDVKCYNVAFTNFLLITTLSGPNQILIKNNIQLFASGVIKDDQATIGNSGLLNFNYSLKAGKHPTTVVYDGAYVAATNTPYPIKVIPSASLHLPSVTGHLIPVIAGGNILMIEAGLGDTYLVGDATIDDIRFSNTIQNLAYDYSAFAQMRYATGVCVTLIPQGSGFVTNETLRLFPLNTGARAEGVPIRFAYDKGNSIWVEIQYIIN